MGEELGAADVGGSEGADVVGLDDGKAVVGSLVGIEVGS